jgi:hypothetical protein
MKNGFLPTIIAGFGLLLTLCAFGCKPENIDLFRTALSSEPVSLSINPPAPSMAPGTTLQLEAVGTLLDSATKTVTSTVTWSSANPEVANVNAAGMVTTAPTGSGTTTITASFGPITASAVLTVVPLASLSVTPADTTVAPGTSQQFTATGTLQNSATQDLTESVAWQSSNGIATIDHKGLVLSGSAGTASITASLNGISATGSVTVAEVQSIAVTPFNSSVTTGTTHQFTATATLSNNATQNITGFATWESSNVEISIINNQGLAQSISPGTAIITASFRGASGSASLTATEPNLVSLSITPAKASIAVGASEQLSVIGKFSDGTTQDLTADATWTSSNAQVAAVSNSVGAKGLATGISAGSTGIRASLSNVTSNQSTVTVTSGTGSAVNIVSITVTPAAPVVRFGDTVQLTATGLSSDGTIHDLTSQATWSSSDIGIVFVSQGLAFGLGTGPATVTATSGNASGSTLVTVTPL